MKSDAYRIGFVIGVLEGLKVLYPKQESQIDKAIKLLNEVLEAEGE